MAAWKVLSPANEANAFSRELSPPLPRVKTWINIVVCGSKDREGKCKGIDDVAKNRSAAGTTKS